MKIAVVPTNASVSTPIVFASVSGRNKSRICGEPIASVNGIVAAMPSASAIAHPSKVGTRGLPWK